VIVDVGGQDIKLIILKRPREGFQAQHAMLGGQRILSAIDRRGLRPEGGALRRSGFLGAVDADVRLWLRGVHAVRHREFPAAGLAGRRKSWRARAVLPKNVFLYVASIPNLAALGTRFVLQGGTQNNMAVVKAEVDFIRNSFRAAGKQPEIIVHEHCGESGAIGAAVEARAPVAQWMRTTFVGLDAVRKIEYRTTRNEDTRCNFCKNNCLRTFIDIRTAPKRLGLCDAGEKESHQGSADARRAAPDHRHLRKGHRWKTSTT
jgi:hypothetical protein